MIGAGIAGLVAAQQMQQFGMDVIVLEARVSYEVTFSIKYLHRMANLYLCYRFENTFLI